MKFNSDIDIDLANRDELISIIECSQASIKSVTGEYRKHNTGIYPTKIPCNPIQNIASVDYVEAEQRGYLKIDLLNVHVYSQIKNESHLISLLYEPDWNKLNERTFVERLIHLSNHYDNIQKMPEPINSVDKLAMFLALIRPAKKHLLGKNWDEVSVSIWEKEGEEYHFKKSHSFAYAHLVMVHMNMLSQ